MALRDQPYIPLYVKDLMTDEKLNECCAATHGIFIKGIMCLMHKSEHYGKILLKQNFKQNSNICLNFACQLAKHLPYSEEEIAQAIDELIRERVCYFEGDFLCQKRMIRDNDLSIKRSLSGSKGGKVTQRHNFAKAKSQANDKANDKASDKASDQASAKAKSEANTANANEYVYPLFNSNNPSKVSLVSKDLKSEKEVKEEKSNSNKEEKIKKIEIPKFKVPEKWPEHEVIPLIEKWYLNRKKGRPDGELIQLRIDELYRKQPEWKDARLLMKEAGLEGWNKLGYPDTKPITFVAAKPPAQPVTMNDLIQKKGKELYYKFENGTISKVEYDQAINELKNFRAL